MKKILAVLILILLSAGICSAEAVRSSGLQTSDAAITAAPCEFYGILIITDGSNDATAIVYDHASAASGTAVFKGKITGANNFGGGTFEHPVEMFNGIFVDVTGTNAAYIIYWKNK